MDEIFMFFIRLLAIAGSIVGVVGCLVGAAYLVVHAKGIIGRGAAPPESGSLEKRIERLETLIIERLPPGPQRIESRGGDE